MKPRDEAWSIYKNSLKDLRAAEALNVYLVNTRLLFAHDHADSSICGLCLFSISDQIEPNFLHKVYPIIW